MGGQFIQEWGFKLRQGCEVVVAKKLGQFIDCLERKCSPKWMSLCGIGWS
jgi:hypothetical protein